MMATLSRISVSPCCTLPHSALPRGTVGPHHWCMRPVYFALISLCAACTLYGDDLEVEGEHFQYVVSELRIPTNNTMAVAFSLDLNDDKHADNQLGSVFGALATVGLGVGE